MSAKSVIDGLIPQIRAMRLQTAVDHAERGLVLRNGEFDALVDELRGGVSTGEETPVSRVFLLGMRVYREEPLA